MDALSTHIVNFHEKLLEYIGRIPIHPGWFSKFTSLSILLGILMASFSPLLGFHYCAITLIVFTQKYSVSQRRTLSFLMVLMGVISISSRNILVMPEDDMTTYYNFYYLNNPDRSLFSIYHYGEFFFYSVINLIHFLNPSLGPHAFVFLVSAMTAVPFWIWLEFRGTCEVPSKYRAMVVGFSIFFFDFFLTTQLARQMFATSILLMSTIPKSTHLRVFFFLIAVFSHFATIPLFILYILCKKYPYQVVLTLLAAGPVIFLFFRDLIFFLQPYLKHLPGANKLDFFFRNTSGFSTADMHFFWPITLILLAFLYFNAYGTSLIVRSYFAVLVILYYALLPFPLMSLRLPLPLTGFLQGYFGIIFTRRAYTFSVLLLIALSIRAVYYPLYKPERPPGGFSNWAFYPPISDSPFYYVTRLLQDKKLPSNTSKIDKI